MIGRANTFRLRILRWYDAHQRTLPWRASPADAKGCNIHPYKVLISEAMLQQTTVAAVIPYFRRFIADFPTVQELAAADERAVLRLWQGLGYYARARNLLKAARAIVADHGGRIPRTLEGLRSLPGVGPYTAGAVASIAFGLPCALVDANVARVLSRVFLIEDDVKSAAVQRQLWRRAGELVPQARPGDFNCALMDLGATVCTPRAPRCDVCPVRAHCRAAEAGRAEEIPARVVRKKSPLYLRQVFCIGRKGRWLLEQRPPTGRWAGMWQFPTVEDDGRLPATLHGLRLARVSRLAELAHTLSHRRYRYRVYRADGAGKLSKDGTPRRWLTLGQIDRYPLPGPHAKVAKMLL